MTEKRIHIKPIPKPLARADFFTRVDTSGGEDACWPWMAGRTRAGYGSFYRNKKHIYAHKEAYEIGHGPIASGLFVCHSCDNPPCCNPKHLFSGTHKDNMDDMKNKGRHPSGEAAYNSVLTAEKVSLILSIASAGDVKQSNLASMFGVNRSVISEVLNGKAWNDGQRPIISGTRKGGRNHGLENGNTRHPPSAIEQVHELRKRGLTQCEIATRLDMSQSSVSRILLGQTRVHG